MKKYLYLWIEKYRNLDDFDESKGSLFENFGVNLSSQYIFRHEWKSKRLKIYFDEEIERKENSLEYFYSENIVDLKAIVGDNGCGKTTLLTSLFHLVAEGLSDPPSGMKNYALIYAEGGIFFIKTSLKDEALELPSLFKKAPKGISSKSNYAIYYSTAFDDQEYRIDGMRFSGDITGTSNISTNALLFNDEEAFKNESLSNEGDYPDQLDVLHCYYSMEQQRRIEFLCDFIDVEDFWSDFNLPKKIQLTVINENVHNAFYELIHQQLEILSPEEFIFANNLEKTKWKKISQYPINGELYDLKNDVIESYTMFFDSLKLTDQFRFAAMMNFYRTWKDKEVINLMKFNLRTFNEYFINGKLEFDRFLSKMVYEVDSQSEMYFLLSHCREQLSSALITIDSILNIVDGFIEKKHKGFATYKNGFMNNAKVFFDLHKHKKEFVNVVTLYKQITKTSPFLFFGFDRALSSGESSMLKLYSRLYNALKEKQNKLNTEEFHLFLDEIDLYLHPEWQRQWLQRFIDGMKYIGMALHRNLKVQVFLTTHSPFMLTDFLTESLLLLRREDVNHGTHIVEYENADSSNCNFGANIYDLVDSGFFLKNTIGYFAENKIKKYIEDPSQKDLKYLVEKIGDPVLKVLINTTINGRKRK